MEPKAFAYNLSSWISPGILARAASDWSDRPDGHEVVHLRFESPFLENASDARYDCFIERFLDHAVIPEELIRLTRGMYPRQVDVDAANWLREFQFTGVVEFDPDKEPQVPGQSVLVEVRAPLCEVRVIWPPLTLLTELISVKASYWVRAAKEFTPDQIHFQARGEWEFEASIDLSVARACGFPDLGEAARSPAMNMLDNVRGHARVVGPLPESKAFLAALAVAAGIRLRERSSDLDLYQKIVSGGD